MALTDFGPYLKVHLNPEGVTCSAAPLVFGYCTQFIHYANEASLPTTFCSACIEQLAGFVAHLSIHLLASVAPSEEQLRADQLELHNFSFEHFAGLQRFLHFVLEKEFSLVDEDFEFINIMDW